MNNPRRHLFIKIIGLIWMVIVLIGYSLLHKPFNPSQIIIIGEALLKTLEVVIIIYIAGGVGKSIYDRFFSTKRPSITQQAGLGLAALCVIFLGVSVIIGIQVWISIGILVILFILGYKNGWLWLKQTKSSLYHLYPKNNFEKLIFSLLILNLILTWMISASPPIKYDALLYHLELPKWYLIKGHFSYIPQNEYWGMPQTGEILYTLAMSIGGDSAALLLGWAIGLLAILAVLEILPDRIKTYKGWLGVVIPLTGLSFLDGLSWGYIDWMTYFWGALALQVVIEGLGDFPRSKIIEAGLFCGFALGTKYTAGILIIAILPILIWLRYREGSNVNNSYEFKFQTVVNLIKDSLIFSSVVVGVTLPWWIKNLLATAQPFYPLIFPAGTMTPLRLQFYTHTPIWGDKWTAIFLPLTATILGMEGKAGFSASISPLFLILIPFAWLGFTSRSREQKNILLLLGEVALILWAVWGIGAQISGLMIQTRFYWCLFPALVVLAVMGYENIAALNPKPLNFRFIVNGVILIVLVFTTFQELNLTIQRKTPDYLMGINSEESYLENNLGWYAVAMEHIRTLKPAKPVLLLFEPRDYYCLPYCDSDEILDEWYLRSYLANAQSKNSEKIIQDLMTQGYGYILIYQDGVDFVKQNDLRYTSRQWDLLTQLTSNLKPMANFGNSYLLYQVTQ